jgi:hypothetical protein
MVERENKDPERPSVSLFTAEALLWEGSEGLFP